jgi:hypothetical protein
MESIQIGFADSRIECGSVIIIPEKAVEEAGYIRTMAAGASAHSKHAFHAMAQMALYQYEDGELVPETVQGPLTVTGKDADEVLQAGMVIAVDALGGLRLIVHAGQNSKKLLEAAHRFCTRWVRLDI